MSYSTKHSTSTVIAGEGHLEITPKFANSTLKNGVAFVHGAGSSALYCLDPYGNQNLATSDIVNAGFTVMSDDNGGSETWGNDLSISRLNANINYLRDSGLVNQSGKVALVSGSMGGIVSLNYALKYPDKVSCIVSTIPVINPEDIRANNRSGYAASINTAYGGLFSEATMGADHNPYTFRAAAAIANIPMLFFYGATDTLCLPAFTEAFAAAAPAKRTIVSLPTGHAEATYANINRPQLVSFLQTYNV